MLFDYFFETKVFCGISSCVWFRYGVVKKSTIIKYCTIILHCIRNLSPHKIFTFFTRFLICSNLFLSRKLMVLSFKFTQLLFIFVTSISLNLNNHSISEKDVHIWQNLFISSLQISFLNLVNHYVSENDV